MNLILIKPFYLSVDFDAKNVAQKNRHAKK